MRRGRLLTTLLTAACTLGLNASASASISVSTSGGQVHISPTNEVLGTTVSYQFSGNKFTISDGGTATTSDSDCTNNGSSIVLCDDNGEDTIDVDFGSSGGFVKLDTLSSLVPGRFSSDVTLGNGSDTVDGTDGTDIVHAASISTVNADTIRTLDGNDTITTGNGSDIVSGGDDADTIVANDGNNILNGGEFADDDFGDGNDTITGGPLADTIDGGLGDDTLNGGTDPDASDNADTDQIDGRRGNDTINAGDGPDTDIDGGPGNDTVNGDSGNDTLFGGANTSGGADTDVLNGGTGADVLLNSAGPDTFHGGTSAGDADEVDYSQTSGSAPVLADIDGGSADDGTNCGLGPCEGDTIATDVENLTGDGGPDTLTGSSGANLLDGRSGDDLLDGGQGSGADGADRFIGGASNDTVDYTGRTGALVVSIDGAANDGAGGCPSSAGCEDDDVETDVENLIGGSAADTLSGSSAANQLFGGSGSVADTLNGLGGDDTLVGGDRLSNLADGPDIFNGGTNSTGGDTVSYATRSGVAASIDGVANDFEGDNVGTDVENLIGSNTGADTLSGSTAANVIDGKGGNDTISGGSGAATDGNDTLIGGTGTSDTVSYAPRTGDLDVDLDGVDDDGEGTEADHLETFENITGGSGDDDLTGNSGANVLSGGGGDDDLMGGPGPGADGADTFIGGSQGTAGGQNSNLGDVAAYNPRTDALTLSIGDGADDGASCPGGGCEGDDIQSSVEGLRGGSNGDSLTGDAGPNRILGLDGNDTLRGGAGAGPDGADSFVPGNGIDTVSYSNRNDPITAGIGTGSSSVTDGDSIDTGTENLTGGSGDDTLRGTSTNNTLSGGSGDDTLFGGQGTGPDGADTFFSGPSAGDDTVSYANRTDAIHAAISGTGAGDSGGNGGAEGDGISTTIDNLIGGSAGDELLGDTKANKLDGGAGADDLTGGGESDMITGGPGADDVDAGPGADTVFAIDGVIDTIECGTEADTAFADASPADVTTGCETIDNDGPDPPVEPPVDPPVEPPVDPPSQPPANPPVNPPAGRGDDGACAAARSKLAKAKRKLKKAKATAVAAKVKRAKKAVRKARVKVRKNCA